MKCEDMLKALNEYVDGSLDPSICEHFEEHLADCDPCQVVIDNIRNTIKLFKDGEPYPIPPELEEKLKQCLEAKWKEKFTQK
jgi:anti-sigma factor RsiW